MFRGQSSTRRKRRGKKMLEAPPEESLASMTLTLNNGVRIPGVGLGTYKMRQFNTIEAAVDAALSAGYRLFDTAAVYCNEASLGEALKKLLPKYNLERDDVFITTKLPPTELGNFQVIQSAYQRSLDNLGLEYVDLYLIHFPGCSKLSPHDIRNQNLRRTTWQAFTQLYEEGRVNSIGVANFTVRHLKDLDIKCSGVVPAVNQVEWHPHYYQDDLLEYCRKNDICVQAYGSFGGASTGDNALLEEPLLKKIADEHGTGVTQVLLAWALQRDIAVIPKSVSPERIRDNIDINFRLTDNELRALNGLREKGRKYAWDPTDVR